KKRHFKRRFVTPENLNRIARVLKAGAPFYFASDIDSYVSWTLEHMANHSAFEWTDGDLEAARNPYPGWPGTRYEEKAIKAGRIPHYLTFRRR
ncbi:MAG: tRNA (guanosine(46)-N7)-methyltransferase TrmB, partial [Pseudomonadota bacterium]